MLKKINIFVVMVSIAALMNGCFGTFAATRMLYNFNDGFDNKFVKTLIMWCFTIVPAYELFIFADWLILNTIEFFTGSPVISSAVDYKLLDDGTVVARYNGGETIEFKLASDNKMMVERDGVVLGEVQVNDNKQWTLTDYERKEVREVQTF